MKVLLIVNALPAREAVVASDVENRVRQLWSGLQRDGTELLLCLPDHLSNSSRAPEGSLFWGTRSQESIIADTKPDVVIFSGGWDHVMLRTKPECPLVLDLPVPAFGMDLRKTRALSSEKKVQVFGLADCITTTTHRLRSYFSGWLVQAGRVPENEDFIRVVPPSAVPLEGVGSGTEGNGPRFLAFASSATEDDQWDTLIGLAEGLLERRKGELEIVADLIEPARASGTVTEGERAALHLRSLATDAPNQIHFTPADRWLRSRTRLTGQYVGVHVPSRNVLQELTLASRDLQLLASGIPLIHNNYSELSSLLWEHDAGWVVDPGNRTELSALLEEIFHLPANITDKGAAARKVIAENFTSEKTVCPLLNFLEKPRRTVPATPVLGAAYPRPAPLSVNGRLAAIRLTSAGQSVRQRFILPSEGIAALEFPMSFEAAPETARKFSVRARVLRADGRVVVARTFQGADLLSESYLSVSLPALFPPRGGEELVFELSLNAKERDDHSSIVTLALPVLREGVFPFLQFEAPREVFELSDSAKNGGSTGALAIQFLPMEVSPLFRTKLVIGRGFDMLRRGDFLRVSRALSRRLPQVYQGMKRQVFGRSS